MLQYSMTTITVEGVERACAAGEWLNKQNINYELTGTGVISSGSPKYHFMFSNTKDATHFALKWR